MKKTILFSLTAAAVLIFMPLDSFAQKKARLGRVCGDPTAACKYQESFEPNGLPFDHGKNFVIAESERFYAIVLSSVKIKEGDDCNTLFPESDRLAAQSLFPKNKVFALRCMEPGNNYYTNVANDVGFMGVFAGRTLAQANALLVKVKAAGKFPGAYIRRMQTGFNGT